MTEILGEEYPIDAILTSDLEHANEVARKALDDMIRPQQKDHPVRYVETTYLREIARGPLEGARCHTNYNGQLSIVLEPGKALPNSNGKPSTAIVLPRDQSLYDFLYSLDDPNIGEDRAAIEERIKNVRDSHLREYERNGGRVMVFGHALIINHLRNYLVDGDIVSRPFESLSNLAVIRLSKASPRSPYKEISGPYVINTQENALGTGL